ncbi:MTH938/NDUFAF3 family protein [Methylocystis sp. IM3]|uniref:Mth938-like domain-containing protein n=1 Tax=unclassified Methylocystis TaxID=2625913 RepID=UPI0030FCA64A
MKDTAAKGRKMTIDDSRFGSITVDGKTYEHDVIIRLSGDIEKRKKKLSKEKYGTSHIISKDEAKFVYEDGCEIVIVGTGQQDNVRLSPEASEYLSKKGCNVVLQPTPEAIHSFNETRKRKVGLMHVTC